MKYKIGDKVQIVSKKDLDTLPSQAKDYYNKTDCTISEWGSFEQGLDNFCDKKGIILSAGIVSNIKSSSTEYDGCNILYHVYFPILDFKINQDEECIRIIDGKITVPFYEAEVRDWKKTIKENNDI